MSKLIFKAADLLRVVDHSLAAPKQGEQLVDYNDDGPVTEPVEAPAVLLVHDQGVYLMSNGQPRDIVEGISSYCAFAECCNPKTDGEWWNNARDLVGGDDFGETLPWAAEIKALIDAGEQQIIIDLTDGKIELLPPSRKRKPNAKL